eukprot:TRINITY_DN788_c0_g1_i2.p1 TRINITY_DN788_c0_g1~~TRINITY_DN788_c0_g1_i2.p1  ORF type:complete len:421 (+),score=87.02 TRINITY_DN788_c0_g1_i2:186-1448(+)
MRPTRTESLFHGYLFPRRRHQNGHQVDASEELSMFPSSHKHDIQQQSFQQQDDSEMPERISFESLCKESGSIRFLYKLLVCLCLVFPIDMKSMWQRVLPWVLHAFIWLALIRHIAIVALDGISTIYIVYLLWFVMVVSIHLWLLVVFSAYITSEGESSELWFRDVDVEWLSKKVYVANIVAICVIVINCVAMTFLLFSGVMYEGQKSNETFLASTPVLVVYIILNFFLSFAWILPVAIFISFCLMLGRQFFILSNLLLANAVDVRNARKAFEMYDRWCTQASGMFKMFIGVSLSVNVFFVVFLLYRLIFYYHELDQLLIEVFWIVIDFFYLTFVCMFAAFVNDHAMRIHPIVKRSDWQDSALEIGTSQPTTLELQRWLLYLTTSSFGIKLGERGIVITRRLFLEALSIVATYFFLLVQFR